MSTGQADYINLVFLYHKNRIKVCHCQSIWYIRHNYR